MARYKRWFPVNQDINRDPEFIDLADKFGAKGIMFWLEVLSILDRQENVVDLSPRGMDIIRRLIGVHSRSKLSSMAIQCVSNGWLTQIQPESKHLFMSPKYAEYHRTLGTKNKNLVKNSSPSFPFLTSSSSDSRKNLQKKKETTLGHFGFEAFWKSYPRKKKKGDAERAWQVLKPSRELQQVMAEAIERAKTSKDWRKDNGQFIPYPATWLRARGWEDEDTVRGNGNLSPEEFLEQAMREGEALKVKEKTHDVS